ncbi:hypothetical protein [Trichormus azollae]|uniref:hypothetical protein n=1 Tax=Trichormus azollae TaxID=1164 RepID=UPI00325D1EC6
MDFSTKRGRISSKGELVQEAEICAEFGTLRRAFHVIIQGTDSEELDAITDKSRQDLMVYSALCNFSRYPNFMTISTSSITRYSWFI